MHVLVVEDEPMIRLGLASLMEQAGHVAFEAPDADAAIALMTRRRDVDLVITDVDMPGSMDGIGLAHYVRRQWPLIHLIVISGKVGVSPGDLPLGARFISKPYQEAALVGLIEGLLAGGRPWSGEGKRLG